MTTLEGKLALITGAAAGLGASIATGMAAEGARIVLCDVDAMGLSRTAEAIHAIGGTTWQRRLDVAQRADVQDLAARLEEDIGPIDILVNNAGIAGRAAIDDPNATEVFDRIMAVNIHGAFNVCHAFVPALKRTRGTIVNVASVISFVSGASSTGYAVSKGGIRSLTQVLARELAPFGVRVNAVAPGVMATQMAVAQKSEFGAEWYLSRVMMKRIGEVDEIVGPVVFLASKQSSYVTGVVLPVDGGFLAA